MNWDEETLERRRLAALERYQILDTLPEDEYDAITRLASQICQKPMAAITLLDERRAWMKSARGLPLRTLDREEAFCNYATNGEGQLLIIPDARQDARFAENPLTTGTPHVTFYAGAPLITPTGEALGSLCVMDQQPGQLGEEQQEMLQLLARQVISLLEKRRTNTQLIRHQVELVAANQLLQSVVDHTPAGLALFTPILDADGAIVDFRYTLTNAANAETTRTPVEAMVGRPLREVFPDIVHTDVFETMARVVQTGEPESIQQHYRIGSMDAHVEGAFRAVGDSVLFTFMDVTKLVCAQRKAEEALQVRDLFLANVSHELRTPLNSILGFSELLMDRIEATEEKGYVNNIRLAGRSLLQLINSLLDLAKLDSGQLEIEQAPTSLAEVLETVSSMMTVQAGQKGLQFITRTDSDLPAQVESDPLRLTQILLNLCGNAVKFTTQGRVELVARIQAQDVHTVTVGFQVTDTGIGIPADQLSRIFDRYTQSSASTSRHYGGTGLGLNIVRNLVSQMGGQISVESEPGNGTAMTVTLTFPRLAVPVIAPSRSAAEASVLPADLKVLVVEDNPFNQKLISVFLSGYGIEPQLVSNGLEALALLRKQVPDLILMDVQMPYLDGYQTTSHIRRTLQLEVPIIAITANAMASEQEACLKAGMNDYLSKPFGKAQLVAKLAQWGAQREAFRSPGPSMVETFHDRIQDQDLRESFLDNYGRMEVLCDAFLEEWPGQAKILASLLDTGQTEAFRQQAQGCRSQLYALAMHQAADTLLALEMRSDEPPGGETRLGFTGFIDLVEESLTALQTLLRSGRPS